MTDTKYWVAFSRIPNLGTVRFRLLEGYFSSLADAWSASLGDLKAAGIDDKTARGVIAHRPGISPDMEMDKLERAQVKAINWNDSSYPPRLKEISDPPPITVSQGKFAAGG